MRTILCVLVAAGVVAAGVADGAGRPVGSLTQLPGTRGCFVDPSSYTSVNGCARAHALKSPQTVVLSPDDRFAYTPSNSSNAITAFRRVPGGGLSELGCVSSVTPGCAPAVDTALAFGIAIPPDGRSLYLTTTSSASTLDAFSRDPATGAIAQLAGKDACFGRDAACSPDADLRTPRGVAFSPDGRFLYVASFSGNAVAILARDPASSRLAVVGCVKQGSRSSASCRAGAHDLDGATDVKVSPDGAFVYVTAYRGNAISAFRRDPATGTLTEVGCWATAGLDGCAPARGLSGAYDLALSPDGRDVYVAARRSAAVATFARDAASGTLAQPAGVAGCVADTSAEGCRPAASASLAGARGVAVSPDGHNVYAGAFSASALSIFTRDATTGVLRQRPGAHGCITNHVPGNPPVTAGCASGRGLHDMWGIAITRDGRWLYTGDGGDANSGLAIFRRSTAPAR